MASSGSADSQNFVKPRRSQNTVAMSARWLPSRDSPPASRAGTMNDYGSRWGNAQSRALRHNGLPFLSLRALECTDAGKHPGCYGQQADAVNGEHHSPAHDTRQQPHLDVTDRPRAQ